MNDRTDPSLTLSTASYKAWKPGRGVLVRTSLGRPRWYPRGGADLPSLWEATPRGWYFHAEREDFDRAYLEQLDTYGVDRIRWRLNEIAANHGETRLYLACFEADPMQCHRGLFADWWGAETGEAVIDLSDEQ